ncbi:glucosaminidase domain-containing protein, partial [Ligilactobacillus salivarius]
MTEKKKTISDNSLVKQAYIASGIALLSLGAGTAVNSNNVKADTLNTQNTNSTTVVNTTKVDTSQSSVNNSESQNNNSQTNSNTLQLSKRNVQVNNATTNTQNVTTNTENNNTSLQGQTIQNDVSTNSSAAAHNATLDSGVVKNDNNISYDYNLTNAPASVTNFVNQVGSAATKVADEYGVYASVMMAQAGLESAWGQSSLSRNAHNLFGVKYKGTGNYIVMPTLEYYGGAYHTVNARFQKYDSYYDSLVGYAQLIKNNFYLSTKTNSSTYQQAANNLRNGKWGSYATDPGYANKLINLINLYGFQNFDKAQSSGQEKYINGHWYLYKNNQKQTGFQYLSSGNKIAYYNQWGQMLYGQQQINGHWYYFDPLSGAMQTGLKYISDQKKNVYYNTQGQMVYGQQLINGHWYLFSKYNGAMLTGFQNLADYGQNKVVYYDKNGQMLNGQQAINGHWYLFSKYNGAMLTGFQNLADYGQDKVVYYDKNGQMLYGQQLINGHWYLFSKYNGAMLTGFQNLADYGQDKVVYYDKNGQMLYGQQLI